MPHKGGRKRTATQKAYAQKAAQKRNDSGASRGFQAKAQTTKEFSMFDAARNTEHRGTWGDKKLRHTRVDFVTATAAETSSQRGLDTETGCDNDAARGDPILSDAEHAHEQMNASEQTIGDQITVLEADPSSEYQHNAHRQSQHSHQAFFIDPTGDSSLKPTGFEDPQPSISDSDSETRDSDSSDEVILFAGRNARSRSERDGRTPNDSVKVVEEDIRAISLEEAGFASRDYQQVAPSDTPPFHSTQMASSAEDEAVADYIANVLAQQNDEHRAASYRQSPQGALSANDGTEAEAEADEDDEEDDEGDSNAELSDLEIDSDYEEPDESKLDQAASIMTDEQIARRLAKQEELGFGSSEILLWGEGDVADIPQEEGEDFSLEVLRAAARKISNRSVAKRRSKAPLSRMMESLVDADGGYGDFDVMDFDRPSVQRRGKGDKHLPFEVSDSELEADMITAWENDRTKKKQRKIQREAMRAAGLIGGGENAQMRARYPAGITIGEVKEEIRLFLRSDMQILPLIPMDKRSRKAVHEIANRLNLRSKSKGDGFDRYPCLYKTTRTLPYDAVVIDAIMRRYGAGKAGRLPAAKSRGMKTERPHRGGGGVTAGVSYRDGETVGASAPALGVENRGHAMLAKMGWTTGTALGAANNKGALEPVPHVVKSTRAGLG